MPPIHQRLPFILLIITLVQVVVTMALLAVAVVSPMVADTVGVGAYLIGYQVSLTYIFCSMASSVSGSLVARWGACAVSQLALLVAAAGCAIITVGRIEAIAIGSALIGIGYGTTNPAASHLLFQFTPASRRNLVFSLKQTGVPLGGVVLGLMLPPIAEAFSWQLAIGCVAVFALVLAVAMLPLRSVWDIDRSQNPLSLSAIFAGPRLVWSLPAVRWLSCCSLCYGAVQLSLMSFTVALLVEDFHYALVIAGATLSAIQAAGAAGRIFWGAVADRVGSRLTLIIIGSLTALGALTIANLGPHSSPVLIVAVLIGFGGVAIGWNGVIIAEAARLAPNGQIGAVTGGMMAFSFLGVVLGPGLFTTVFHALGSYTATFGLLSVCSLLGVAALVASMRASGSAAPADCPN